MVKIIAGNWKMHGTAAMARRLAADVEQQAQAGAEVVLCPPATLLHEVAAALRGSAVRLGGQDCHAAAEGAFTGDISAPMLKEAGCHYVIVGHSERRQGHGETDETVRAKATAALAAGLTPIICVGETLEQRDGGQAEAVVARQVRGSLPQEGGGSQVLLAYEPVWAIGTGRTPSAAEIEAMHRCIKGLLPEGVPVLYGGSVKAANAAEILALNGVGGALVGGASLKAEEFCAIIAACPSNNLKIKDS